MHQQFPNFYWDIGIYLWVGWGGVKAAMQLPASHRCHRWREGLILTGIVPDFWGGYGEPTDTSPSLRMSKNNYHDPLCKIGIGSQLLFLDILRLGRYLWTPCTAQEASLAPRVSLKPLGRGGITNTEVPSSLRYQTLVQGGPLYLRGNVLLPFPRVGCDHQFGNHWYKHLKNHTFHSTVDQDSHLSLSIARLSNSIREIFSIGGCR